MEQIAPVILILVGLLFVIIGLVLTMRVKAASGWPSTSGVMLKSEIAERTTKQKLKNNRTITHTSYEPMVEYQYTVDGKVMTGNRLSFGLTRLTLEKAQEVLNRFPLNAQVPVFYNPRRVKDSRLEVAASAAAPQLIIGIIIGLIGVVWLIVTLL